MRTKAIVTGVGLIALFCLIATLLSVPRKPPQEITVRHVKSVQSSNVTTMTFEIKNHTADAYIFFPNELEIRTGKEWSKFVAFDIGKFHPSPSVNPMGLASCTIEVTNLPAKSVVRFKIRPQRTLTGLTGLIRRSELNLANRGQVPLNPFDRNSKVYGLPIEAVSEEFVEAGLVR